MYRTATRRPASTVADATIPQLEHVERLSGRLNGSDQKLDEYRTIRAGGGTVSIRAASQLIDHLNTLIAAERAAQPAPTPAPAVVVEPGYYVLDDSVYVVVTGTYSTYAKLLVVEPTGRGHWDFARGAMRRLADGGKRLTLDEAKRLSHLHGVCVLCGTRLTNKKSVERSIGPVCIKKI